MTTYTIKIAESEANDVASGKKPFIFRNIPAKEGDEIIFTVMFRTRPRPNPIESMRFLVTYATNDAPIDKNFWAIGIRRIA